MSSGSRNTNNDSCRDLNGRRLGVVKEARKLAEYLEGEPERKRQMDEAQKNKYAKLEKMLGRAPKSEMDLAEAAERMADAGEGFDSEEGSKSPEAGPNRRTGPVGNRGSGVAGTKRKEMIQDTQYVEQSREIVENIRSAVASAMMKKKKKLNKAKATTTPSSNGGSGATASVSAST